MTTQPNDPFAPTDSKPSVSFKSAPDGTSVTLEVTEVPTQIQSRNFDTRELDFWPDGNPKMTVVTGVIDKATGEAKSLWAPKPSSMFAAIVAAQQASGAQIAVGGTLVVTFTHEVPVEGKPHLNPAKQYQVTYTPPNPFAGAPAFAQPEAGAVAPVQQAAQAAVQPTFVQTPQGLVNTTTGQIVQQTIPAVEPVAAPTPVAAAPAQPGPTPEAIAAVRAAGQDPGVIWPGYSFAG